MFSYVFFISDLASRRIFLIESYFCWNHSPRYPCSIANLPDILLKLRRHQSSKSATQKTALTLASNALRWKLVAGLDLGVSKIQNQNQNQNQEFGGMTGESTIREEADNRKLYSSSYYQVTITIPRY